MNIYEKLIACRVELQAMNLKKSGKNKFAGYDYYELSDFLPAINSLFSKHGLCSVVSFSKQLATMVLVDTAEPGSTIQITSPMGGAALKGCHEVQNIGAVESYQRRYLYMVALEICEADALDATTGRQTAQAERPAQPNKQQQTPAARPKPHPPEPGANNRDIFEAPEEAINPKQVRLIRALLDKRGIDPDDWKSDLGIAHISNISWKCMKDYKGQDGLVTQVENGVFDYLIPKDSGHQEEIDLDDDNPFGDEQ